MKRFILTLLTLVILGSIFQTRADEGMWLPLYIKQLNEKQMQSMGCELTAEDIYNINNASIKDAILRLGQGFCTGEIVSDKGLVFTNHHCGYESIAELSTVDNDFLTNGFWAYKMDEEIPVPGLTVSRLVYMENVTEALKDEEEGSDKWNSIIEEATKGNHYEAEIKEYFAGHQLYLLVYETFKDVRFVGAPPSSIGKFGGDTDNWMWPRHTGDFSILRVYTAPDGKPAEFSENNIPYKPLHYLPISLNGVEENDFSMIMGYPGTTERYLSSYDIEFKMKVEQPTLIALFDAKLKRMKQSMDADDKIRIELASDYASLANYWKYLEGQLLGLKRFGLHEKYQEKENELLKWINSDSEAKEKYGNMLSDYERMYKKYMKINPGFIILAYGLMNSEVFSMSDKFNSLKSKLEDEEATEEEINALIEEIKEELPDLYEFDALPIGMDVFREYMVMFYNALEDPSVIPTFAMIEEEYEGKNISEKINAFLDDAYTNSVMFDMQTTMDFLEKPKSKKLAKDPLLAFNDELIDHLRNAYLMTYLSFEGSKESLHSKYMGALMDWKKDKNFYPDANSTLRMTYGKITPYFPRNAVYYNYFTTHNGILEKEDPNNKEFNVDPKLKELLLKKDFGRYGNNDTLVVCFLSNNDITGGNSGSPVINGKGELIGIAFDGNWEAMTGDLVVDPEYNRTISVDIRYVLFVIDKFAGAKNLIDELKIVQAE
jgi:hypothetical protein